MRKLINSQSLIHNPKQTPVISSRRKTITETNSVTARDVTNPTWSVSDVYGQYSYSNPHADLYLYLSQWSDMELYLNVGYSRPG